MFAGCNDSIRSARVALVFSCLCEKNTVRWDQLSRAFKFSVFVLVVFFLIPRHETDEGLFVFVFFCGAQMTSSMWKKRRCGIGYAEGEGERCEQRVRGKFRRNSCSCDDRVETGGFGFRGWTHWRRPVSAGCFFVLIFLLYSPE